MALSRRIFPVLQLDMSYLIKRALKYGYSKYVQGGSTKVSCWHSTTAYFFWATLYILEALTNNADKTLFKMFCVYYFSTHVSAYVACK